MSSFSLQSSSGNLKSPSSTQMLVVAGAWSRKMQCWWQALQTWHIPLCCRYSSLNTRTSHLKSVKVFVCVCIFTCRLVALVGCYLAGTFIYCKPISVTGLLFIAALLVSFWSMLVIVMVTCILSWSMLFLGAPLNENCWRSY